MLQLAKNPRFRVRLVAATVLATLVAPPVARPQSTTSAEKEIAALKQSLTENQKALMQYEWIETTAVSYKGEQKSQTQTRCYYTADGSLEKVQENQSKSGGHKPRGLRGRVAESKTEDTEKYMKSAASLIEQYLPPDPAKIQQAADAGKVSVTPLPGGSVQLDFHSYIKDGDNLSLSFDLESNLILSATVKTYLQSQGDGVSMDAVFSTLPDGTNHVSKTKVDAPAKHIEVQVSNDGYRRSG